MKKYRCHKCELVYATDFQLQLMGSVYFLENPRMLEPVPVTIPIAMLAGVMCPKCHSRKIEKIGEMKYILEEKESDNRIR